MPVAFYFVQVDCEYSKVISNSFSNCSNKFLFTKEVIDMVTICGTYS